VEYSTTTVVPPDYQCRVDAGENLVLELSSVANSNLEAL